MSAPARIAASAWTAIKITALLAWGVAGFMALTYLAGVLIALPGSAAHSFSLPELEAARAEVLGEAGKANP